MSGRLLLANLGGESALAGPGAGPPPRIASRLAAWATLFRACAGPDDLLWTPGPVDRRRVAEVPGLPTPALAWGPWPPAERDGRAPVLAWMSAPPLAGACARPAAPPGLPTWAASDPALTRPLVHRAFGRDVAASLGLLPAGSEVVTREVELARVLAEARGPWVLKPAFSAAGAGHLLGPDAQGAPPRVEAAARAAIARQGWLLFEPWVPRALDAGACGLVDPAAVTLLGSHRLEIDGRGRFRGVTVRRGERGAPDLSGVEQAALDAATLAAGRALQRAGYAGAFGLDAYRAADGSFRPLVEVNVRATFGLLARLLAERVDGIPPGERVTLRLGGPLPPAASGAIVLLHPDAARADGGASAWLQRGG